MTERNGKEFGLVSRLNHWGVVAIFIGMLCFGFYLEFGDLAREVKGPLWGVHKSIGTLFLIFAVWRVGWRIFQGFPQEVAVMPLWQRFTAKITHWLLLLAVLLMPLSGVLMNIYGGRSIHVFDWFSFDCSIWVPFVQHFWYLLLVRIHYNFTDNGISTANNLFKFLF